MTYTTSKKTSWRVLHHFGFERMGGEKNMKGYWQKVIEQGSDTVPKRRFHALIRDKNTIDLHYDYTRNPRKKSGKKTHRASSLNKNVKVMIKQFREYDL